jgi:hypothetical protein
LASAVAAAGRALAGKIIIFDGVLIQNVFYRKTKSKFLQDIKTAIIYWFRALLRNPSVLSATAAVAFDAPIQATVETQSATSTS